MSSQDKNLSDLNYDLSGDASELKISVVHSEWNKEITHRLLAGCLQSLKDMGVDEKNITSISVPGSFELPMGPQMLIESTDPKPNAVICLGCIIRGETSHFDFVAQSVSSGVKDVALKFSIPVVFGVLTDDTKTQSLDRSGGQHGNKGEEAAVTAIRMALLQRKLRM